MSTADRVFGELEGSRRRLLSEIEGIHADAFVQRPPGGGWSVSQVVEHIARSEGSIARGLERAQAGELRVIGQPLDVLRWLVWRLQLYRVVRLRTTATLDPREPLPVAESVALLVRNREKLLLATQVARLSELKLRHPVFGPLSGFEMLAFAALHEERHRLQIVRIKQAIGVR